MTVKGVGCLSIDYTQSVITNGSFIINDIYYSDFSKDITLTFHDGDVNTLPRVLTENTDFTVVVPSLPLPNQSYNIYNMATITLTNHFKGTVNDDTNAYFEVRRNTAISQTVQLGNNNVNYHKMTEGAVDKLTKICQELKCDLNKVDINGIIAQLKRIDSLLPQPNGVGLFLQTLEDPNNKGTYITNWVNFDLNKYLPSQVGKDGFFLQTIGGNSVWAALPKELPSQVGRAGYHLVTNGSTALWQQIPTELPSQNGNAGKYLETDGTNAIWKVIPNSLPSQTGKNGYHLTTNGIVPAWTPSDIPDLSSATDGQYLKIDTGALVVADLPKELPSISGKNGYLNTDGTTVTWKPVDKELPDQTGNAGKHLETDGTNATWEPIPKELPDQTGKTDNFLKTNGSGVSWQPIPKELPDQTGNSNKVLGTDGTNVSWVSQSGGSGGLPDTTGSQVGDVLSIKDPANNVFEYVPMSSASDSSWDISDDSGVITGYDVVVNGVSLDISAFSGRFNVNNKKVDVSFQAQSRVAPTTTGVKFLNAYADGRLLIENDSKVTQDDAFTLANILTEVKGTDVVTDVVPIAKNLKGLANDIRFNSLAHGSFVYQAELRSEGTNRFNFISTVPNKLNVFRFGVNSTNLDDYNRKQFNYTNPIHYDLLDKTGALVLEDQTDLDFSAPSYYGLDGTLNSLGGRGDYTIMLVYYVPNDERLKVTYGYGEYKKDDIPLTPRATNKLYSTLIPLRLDINGILIGGIKVTKGKDFSDVGETVLIPVIDSDSSSGGGVAQGGEVFDIANGLRGGCVVTPLASGTSVSIAFTGKAVFVDDTSGLITEVTPVDVPQFDLTNISTSDKTYLYLQSDGTVTSTSTYIDLPRDKILLAIISHYDRTGIGHITYKYTSSDVDAYRIKEVYNAYRPTTRGIIPNLIVTQDVTDPNLQDYSIDLSAGTFYNYTADPSKLYDDHKIEMTAVVKTGWLFRSLEPKDYGDNWVESNRAALNTLLKEPKIIKPDGTTTTLQDGYATFYMIYINSNSEVLIAVPEVELSKDNVATADGEAFVKDYESKMDLVIWEDYARIGFLSALNEGGVYKWNIGLTIESLQEKFLITHGHNALVLQSHKYGEALVSHKNGTLQEIDPLSYTFGQYGNMVGYPNDALKEQTRSYWVSATDDDVSDGSYKLISIQDRDFFPNLSQGKNAATGTMFNGESSNTAVFNPTLVNNNSKPLVFDALTRTTNQKYSAFYLAIKPLKLLYIIDSVITVKYASPMTEAVVRFLSNKNSNGQYPPEMSKAALEALNPNATVTQERDDGSLLIMKLVLTNPQVGDKLQCSKMILNGVNGTGSGVVYVFGGIYIASGSFPNNALGMNVSMRFADITLPKDHIRVKFGKLSDLNVNTTTATIIKGDKPTDLTAGDIVLYYDAKPKTGTTYSDKTYWNCNLKNNDLLNTIPSISLDDGVGNTKAAHLARVINWHSAVYVIKDVTSAELTGSDVVIRIQDTTDVTGILSAMDLSLGATMANDAV